MTQGCAVPELLQDIVCDCSDWTHAVVLSMSTSDCACNAILPIHLDAEEDITFCQNPYTFEDFLPTTDKTQMADDSDSECDM